MHHTVMTTDNRTNQLKITIPGDQRDRVFNKVKTASATCGVYPDRFLLKFFVFSDIVEDLKIIKKAIVSLLLQILT